MSKSDRVLDTVRNQMLAGLAECHEFEVRSGFRVQLVLPRKMTASEAERLTAFVNTLAVDAVYRSAGIRKG